MGSIGDVWPMIRSSRTPVHLTLCRDTLPAYRTGVLTMQQHWLVSAVLGVLSAVFALGPRAGSSNHINMHGVGLAEGQLSDR